MDNLFGAIFFTYLFAIYKLGFSEDDGDSCKLVVWLGVGIFTILTLVFLLVSL